MRALLLGAALLSACSVLFDPAKVPASDCPTSPARCPTPDNAIASCDGTRCGFSCEAGFRDADQDPANGCEATCAPVAGPSPLIATSVGTSVRWSFPDVPEAARYRLCTSLAAGALTCTTVERTACSAGTCVVETSGLPTRAQVSGQVQALDACGGASPEAQAARATGFTIRTTDVTPWGGDGACVPVTTITGDVLSVEQSAFCNGSATFGDEAWREGTVEVELRPAGQQGLNTMGGLLFVTGTRRFTVLVGPPQIPVSEGSLLLREARGTGAWQAVASSGGSLVADAWSTLRVTVKDAVWSISVGPTGGPLRETLRYRDPTGSSVFRLGLATITPNLLSAGRIDFRNLSVGTSTTLPPAGPTRRQWSFTPAGPVPAARTLGAVGDQLRFEDCPAFRAAPACTTSPCVPDAGTCLRIAKPALAGGAITFELPTGLDPRQPWTFSFRFAPAADGGFASGQLAFTPSGTLLEPENGFDGGVRGLGGRWGLPVAADTWNLVDVRFDPSAGTFVGRLNGQTATPNRIPASWDRHLGAITLGSPGLSVVDFWVSDVAVSQ